MIELNPENVVAYLQSQGRIGSEPVQVELFGWGVSNAVFRIATPDSVFVLKQSRPQLRTHDSWFSDIARVYREQEVMQVLHPLLPPLTVPEVLFSDRENFVFAMSHAPAESQVWKAILLEGHVDLAVGELAGHVLGRIHQATAADPKLIEGFRDHKVFVQLRVDPFYRCIQERRPEIESAVQPIIDRMLSLKESLCHGDYSPKNILVHDRGFTLVDYETAHYGDSTMDLGFFLSHLVLKAIKNHVLREQYFELSRAFWRGYFAEVSFRAATELEAWGIEHFAACALARIDGTSPVDYIRVENKRELVRRLGRQILLDRPTRWHEVIQLCESAIRSLPESCHESS